MEVEENVIVVEAKLFTKDEKIAEKLTKLLKSMGFDVRKKCIVCEYC